MQGVGSEDSGRYVPAVGPRLRGLLIAVLVLFGLLAINSLYLVGVRLLEAVSGEVYQDYLYQAMFLAHLALGLLIVLPLVGFGLRHMRGARSRPNRRAVRVGYALFAAALVLLASGLALTRFDFLEIRRPEVRTGLYWLHVAAPIGVAWLFVLHRLAGPPLRLATGARVALLSLLLSLGVLGVQARAPRPWAVAGPPAGERHFLPALSRTTTGRLVPARSLAMDGYCRSCHADTHERWSHSAHRLSSFNNPMYRFSVLELRRVLLERDGDVTASRFCAGCHDPVPLFSGAFDDPAFDREHPTAELGITCTSCHAITHVGSPRGNADYTIEEPLHYPFAYSDSALLQWVNHRLIESKPDFHRKTFLKPLHQSPEFCGACHKAHVPEEVNDYRFVRGQNHYDSFLGSGVSGHGVSAFYYPERAEPGCNGCHMQLRPSGDLGARIRDESGGPTVHDHLFAAGNTGVPFLTGAPAWVGGEHERFLEGAVRVDVFGLVDEADPERRLVGPLRPEVPALEPGHTYRVDLVIRTLGMGHAFTQGTVDSNQVWLDVAARAGDRVVGRSGARDEAGRVDPRSHFVNAYVIDREGRRIDRRNVQDVFVALYDHQIPPGAADVVRYRLRVPEDAQAPLTFRVALRYRKFDTAYVRHALGSTRDNDLPVATLASDEVHFPLLRAPSASGPTAAAASPIPAWERWNDYGIALLLEARASEAGLELEGAARAFGEVERLGRPEGPLNLARVFIDMRRHAEAGAALRRAAAQHPPAPRWTIAWLSGLIHLRLGHLAQAVASFESLLVPTRPKAERGLDFSRDTRLLNTLGLALFELSKEETTGSARHLVESARERFAQVLAIDPENVTAHHNLGLVYARLGDAARAADHRALHARYRPDDNARDRAIARARARDPAARDATDRVVLYDLLPADARQRIARSSSR